MSLSQQVDGLIEMVERGEFIEAFPRFYAVDAEMQENDNPPRVGIDALIANERMMLAAFPQVQARALSRFVSGDQAVIRWTFEFVAPHGATIRLDELTLQTWRDGRIVHEKFYYDPVQMRPVSAG
ncbi:MAG: ester cyclase [Sphingomonadales bacterium]|nr:ester cyclase [Sphingomonadales bacterium]